MSQATTQSKTEDREIKPVSPRNCVHHWIIETPNGRESGGVCKRCGAHKSFSNSTEQVMWEQTNTLRNDLNRSYRSSKTEEYSLADEA
ncbi:MAG: hypothetical protein M0R73_00430 [Dehalococcoidia bacterium]|nr:hypothetical protein [Dehalococcoidia bacterium]